ncbi:MAG: hypothetical protein A2010_06730 [Nitrospirae bacterium GWD2_57_9]|nr:MAG: hypothetical protein A2010_06730 [Nitrospirae bacterium GWD2_57_9]
MRSGAGQAVLARLRSIPKVRVFGWTEKQVVVVVEDDDAKVLARALKEVRTIEEVTAVYPRETP